MKKNRVEIGVVTIFAAILTLNALIIVTNQKLTWTTLAQAYYEPDDPAPTPNPGIVQHGGNAIIDTPEDNILSLTSFGPDGRSYDTVRVEIDGLAALPANPDEPLEVASTNDRYVVLYKLPSGEYQTNIGPDTEGKIFVYVFEIDPFQCVSRYQFTTTDPTRQFEGPC